MFFNYDYMIDYDIAIEYHVEQHFNPVKKFWWRKKGFMTELHKIILKKSGANKILLNYCIFLFTKTQHIK